MMPMPPTSSEMPAMQIITTSKMNCVRRRSSSSPAGTTTVKSPASLCVAVRIARTTLAVSIESVVGSTFR